MRGGANGQARYIPKIESKFKRNRAYTEEKRTPRRLSVMRSMNDSEREGARELRSTTSLEQGNCAVEIMEQGRRLEEVALRLSLAAVARGREQATTALWRAG